MASASSVGVIIVIAREHDDAYFRTSCTRALVPGSASTFSLQISVLNCFFVSSTDFLPVDWNSLPVLIEGDLARYDLSDATGHNLFMLPSLEIRGLITLGFQHFVGSSFFAKKFG